MGDPRVIFKLALTVGYHQIELEESSQIITFLLVIVDCIDTRDFCLVFCVRPKYISVSYSKYYMDVRAYAILLTTSAFMEKTALNTTND